MVSVTGSDGAPPTPVRVLVDTNVPLDLLLGRKPWATEAKPVWDAHDAGRVHVHASASVLTDVYYICRKQIGADRARVAVGECLRRFTILMVDRTILESALRLLGSDFEDDVQIATAQESAMDLIVTRNMADSAHSPIPAIPPSDASGDFLHESRYRFRLRQEIRLGDASTAL